jgi:hypothetical protein
MKFTALAFAASLVAPALVAGAPRVVQVHPSDIRPRRAGGSRFKLPQVYNENFKQHGKGPRALAKVYEKYGVEMPQELVQVLQKILEELGIEPTLKKISSGFKTHGTGSPYTNETDDQGAWMASPL